MKIESSGLFAVRIGSVILALSLLYCTFHRVDFSHVGQSVAHVGVIGIALIATPQLVSLCLECVGWSSVFRLLGRTTEPRALLRVR
ncbi:MAG TPA: hypothetical protein VGM44_05430, partial [Polyangiaceae bacterium]